jgi:hypothetical protein
MAIARVSTIIGNAPSTAVASSTKSNAPAGTTGQAANTKSTDSDSSDQAVTTQPQVAYITCGIVLAVAGFIIGLLLQQKFHPQMSKLPVIASGFGSVTLIYIMAQAIERALVPVSWFGGGIFGVGTKGKTPTPKFVLKKDRQLALLSAEKLQATDLTPAQATDTSGAPANAAGKIVNEVAQAKADTQHNLDQYRANLTGITFGVSAGLAMAVCGYAGIFLLKTVGITTAPWLDLLVTGLVIAGGTKPLHDLISNISSSSQSKDSATSK